MLGSNYRNMQAYKSDSEAVLALSQKHKELKAEISKVLIGQESVVDSLLCCLFSRGHALLVGVPGLAKTLLVETLSKVLDLSFKRIQFTPDLMPSDICGSEILDTNREYKFIKGPIFANLVLADEINRTPPKTQAALLEAMQEKKVSVSEVDHKLEEPFFVFATQNPIEQEGTYPLPEAQLDRFMFQIDLGYPSKEEEINILKTTTVDRQPQLSTILSKEEIIYFQHLIRKIPIVDSLYEYIVDIVSKTRPNTAFATENTNKYVAYGAGPRASQCLAIGAKARAALSGKFTPDKEDVRAVANLVLKHRLLLNYKAEADGLRVEDIIKSLL